MKIRERNLKFYGLRDIDRLPQLKSLPPSLRERMKVVAHVLPFRANNYIVEELIDWSKVPDDPIFQLTFPQPGMLREEHHQVMNNAISREVPTLKLREIANQIRLDLNPHPAGQMSMNVPKLNNEPVMGIQRKYRETCLVFPSRGQTCHAYCTFCFRWPQFVGMDELKFATDESSRFARFIAREKELTDVLITGGDPLIMKAEKLATYIDPFLEPGYEHIQNIRIGTKSVAYWPYKFVTDPDADDVLRLFERVVKSGKHLAIMGHYNHWQELATPIAQEAIRRIRSTGAQIRTQSPLIRHVNDSAEVWTRMWKDQVNLGCIPYYMFIERDTGARHYFDVPLYRAFEIFSQAFRKSSGLARTARGPSMSALPGKVAIDGVTEIEGEKVFVLSFLQARNPDWCKRPFFARYDPNARWLNHLKPALGKKRFFFEEELEQLQNNRSADKRLPVVLH